MKFEDICEVIAIKHIKLNGIGSIYKRIYSHRNFVDFLKVLSFEKGRPIVVGCNESGEKIKDAMPGQWKTYKDHTFRHYKKIGKIDEI